MIFLVEVFLLLENFDRFGAPETLLDYLIIVQNLENENIFIVEPPPIDNTRVRISYMMNYLNDYILKDFLQRQEKYRENVEKCRIYMKLLFIHVEIF